MSHNQTKHKVSLADTMSAKSISCLKKHHSRKRMMSQSYNATINDDDEDSVADGGPARIVTDTDSTIIHHDIAGRTKRNYETAKLEEKSVADFPRKRKARRLVSTSGKGMLAYEEPGFTDDDEDSDNEEIMDGDEDDDDENDMIEEEDIENEEEAAIIAEVIQDGDLNTPKKLEPIYEFTGALDYDQTVANSFEDLDTELFQTQWNEPHRFDDISNEINPFIDFLPLSGDFDGGDNNLFSVHPTPGVTPNITPRGSISTTIQNLGLIFESPISDVEEGSEDEVADLEPFFEGGNTKHEYIVSTGGKQSWGEETDDDADLVKYFFSSAEEDQDSGNESDESGTYDGETTDEEEDLPLPTPRHKSLLRRASVSSVAPSRPQIFHVDGEAGGPQLGSWIADPSRPICVIEGTKQTFLIPEWRKMYQYLDDNDDDTAAPNHVITIEESESEKSSIRANFDPTLAGLPGVQSGVLNGSDIMGPPEALYPLISDEYTFSDVFNDVDGMFPSGSEIDEVDEYEAGLKLSDFLDFSSSGDDAGKANDESKQLSKDVDGDDDCVQNGHDQMLEVWNRVSVTAFRKRQLQHSQKLAALHAGHSISPNNNGYYKGKETRMTETITPTKKRKVRQKFLSTNHRGSKRPGHQPSR